MSAVNVLIGMQAWFADMVEDVREFFCGGDLGTTSVSRLAGVPP
jgi:hypothetical protein